jgi:hypothetical protein
MTDKTKIKLELTPVERGKLRKHKIKIQDIPKYPAEELGVILNIPAFRAMEISAMAEFQTISSIGIKFAQNLISLGYYSLDELKDKTGAKLVEDLEFSIGVWMDPCVEDQFRLVVHYANNRDDTKRWWDFTEERKKYRAGNGYPPDRPGKAWFEPHRDQGKR